LQRVLGQFSIRISQFAFSKGQVFTTQDTLHIKQFSGGERLKWTLHPEDDFAVVDRYIAAVIQAAR
jgi:hypothetical protein